MGPKGGKQRFNIVPLDVRLCGPLEERLQCSVMFLSHPITILKYHIMVNGLASVNRYGGRSPARTSCFRPGREPLTRTCGRLRFVCGSRKGRPKRPVWGPAFRVTAGAAHDDEPGALEKLPHGGALRTGRRGERYACVFVLSVAYDPGARLDGAQVRPFGIHPYVATSSVSAAARASLGHSLVTQVASVSMSGIISGEQVGWINRATAAGISGVVPAVSRLRVGWVVSFCTFAAPMFGLSATQVHRRLKGAAEAGG